MQFRIADTFTDSLARLTGDEQKAVKTTAFDLQMNPANPGMSFHKLDRARDKHFWSVRVNRDIRIIVHKTESSLLLCYVDHHDKAYQWAERRRLETHPKTGAAQLVEIRETVREIVVPVYMTAASTESVKPALFADIAEEELLGYGVPVDWMDDVRNADEDSLLELTEHLPAEAAEALLELATGGQPRVVMPPPDLISPFEHPDAQRRFRVMTDIDELARALEYPWEKWTIFLHPAQRELVQKAFNGPARVSGSAGTGKTVVALHRAVHLARQNPDARVLMTTFSDTLADSLSTKVKRLTGGNHQLTGHLEVLALDRVGINLHEALLGKPELASMARIRQLIRQASAGLNEARFSEPFLLDEWHDVVDAWQVETWEAYRDVRRLGRKTRLSEQQRQKLWAVFAQVKSRLREDGLMTQAEIFHTLAKALEGRSPLPYDFAVVDEAQDINVAQLRFLAALAGKKTDGLFFAGDLGQRIFQTPFSWKALGVNVRGRSQTLQINYRTSHQIRRQADRLLNPVITDVDGNVEDRSGTVSVFNGPEPVVEVFNSTAEEVKSVSKWLNSRINEGFLPHEMGILVRSVEQLDRAKQALDQSGQRYQLLENQGDLVKDCVSIATMPLAKGLEFRVVVVMACDDEVIPSQKRIESVVDESDLEEVYNTERHLLYVACTRARDHLWVSGVSPASEFLDDLIA